MLKFTKDYTQQELAEYLNAKLINGNDDIISSLSTIEKSKKHHITFVANRSYVKYLDKLEASVVIIEQEFADKCTIPALVTKSARLALTKILYLCEKANQIIDSNIHSSAVVDSSASIAPDVKIGPNVVIGKNVSIESGVIIGANSVISDDSIVGQNSVLHANVTIYRDCVIGNDSTIHSSTVIGSDGFGFANDNGQWRKMLHLGRVVIGNRVEIGSNTSVDRGLINDTKIDDDVIIDNLVQIAHNVHIGSGTAIAGCVGIAGSTSIGKNCLIGGGASIAGHIEIVDGVVITGMSGVNNTIAKSGVYSSGLPADNNSKWRRNIIRFSQLDTIAKRVKNLETVIQGKK